jgi:hypothetical protein
MSSSTCPSCAAAVAGCISLAAVRGGEGDGGILFSLAAVRGGEGDGGISILLRSKLRGKK